jgi:hypothetical protein
MKTHFGISVFDYLPWFKYGDIDEVPSHEEYFKGMSDFLQKYGLDKFWHRTGDSICNSLGSSYANPYPILVCGNIATYYGLNEWIESWEDVEMIRLRYLINTPDKAKEYIDDLKFYRKLSEVISDCIYMQLDRDIVVEYVNLKNVSIPKIDLLTDDMINEVMKDGRLPKYGKSNSFTHVNFLTSVQGYYNRNGKITDKQMTAVKKSVVDKFTYIKKDTFAIRIKKYRDINTNRILSLLRTDIVPYKLNFIDTNDSIFIHK